MTGFLYPNEFEIQWGLLIVLYPYLTGLVAGAFIVSALYHVFGVEKLKPVARFSLLTSLSFLFVAPLTLLVHLGRPERALEILWTPQPRSAMSGFGYILLFYLTLVVFETWLAFRKDIVESAHSSQGFKKGIYSLLSLGVDDVSEKSLQIDGKIIKVLSAIGLPAAVVLHGYVGFIFGGLKANPWWSSPLTPVIFLFSAIVSGVALLLVLYIGVTTLRRKPLDGACLRSLTTWLLGFLLIDLTLEGLEVLSMYYESAESWQAISPLLTDKLAISFLGIQLALGSLVPLLTLAGLGLFKLGERLRTALVVFSALLILVGVFAMRWNVVIGGQMFSKSLRGFRTYVPPLEGREGILMALALLVLPFLIFTVMSYFLPPWRGEEGAEEKAPEIRTRRLTWRVSR